MTTDWQEALGRKRRQWGFVEMKGGEQKLRCLGLNPDSYFVGLWPLWKPIIGFDQD
jgi:hypothetical protein